MENYARELLAKAGVRTEIPEDALHDIVTSSSEGAETNSRSPFSPAESVGARSESDNLSLPPGLLAELSALQHGQGYFGSTTPAASGYRGPTALEAVRRE